MTRRRWWLLGGLVVLAWAVATAFLLGRAAVALGEGRDAARAARHDVDAGALAAGRPLPDLRRARERFATAASSTGNPLLVPVRFVPVVGRQLRSVHALAGAAREVSDAAVEAATRARDVLAEEHGGGPARVEQVRALRDAVRRTHRRVAAVHDLGPGVALFGPLARARDELASQLADARRSLADASAGATAGLRLLEGPRRYLLVAANNAEMRAGSGMWLAGGVLTTAGGRLHLGPVSPLFDLADPPNGALSPADPDFAARWEAVWHPGWDWRGLMVSPRMPASAALGLRMWERAGRQPVDGVLAVDPVGLAAVVRATGPVTLDGGRRVTADDVVPLLLHDQYLRFGAGDPDSQARRDELGAIAGAAFEALDAGQWSPATLAGELASAVAGRHLSAYSADPVEQRGWEAAGMDADLGPDSLLVSVLNRGGNKLDWFLPVDARLTTTPRGTGTDVTVRLTLRNEVPAGEPAYVAGPPEGKSWPYGRYLGVVTVDVPGAATDVRIDGVERPLTSGSDGRARVVAAEVVLDRGARQQFVLRFRLPGRHGSIRVEPSARVPAITWDHAGRRWQDSRERSTNW